MFPTQCIVAIHSDLLRRILLPRHQIEFDIVDIDRSLAYLYGRRLPDTEASAKDLSLLDAKPRPYGNLQIYVYKEHSTGFLILWIVLKP